MSDLSALKQGSELFLSVVLDTVAEHLIDNLLKFLDHLNT